MVHSFTVNGDYLAVDTESGSLHALDGTAYEVLRILPADATAWDEERIRAALPGLAKTAVREALEEIRALTDARQLYVPGDAEQSLAAVQNRQPAVKALCLHVAHACNLRCVYCFAGQGTYGGDKGLMGADTGRAAVDFLISHSGKRRNLEVDFFGGEPMLAMDTVRATVAYGRAREREANKRFRFTLTTNATLLEEKDYAFINAEMDNVVLSLDGRPAVHDRARANADGTGGYGDVVPKVRRFVQSRGNKPYYVRGTYTAFNRDFAADVLRLADEGFAHISVEPVVADPAADYALGVDDVPLLCAEYERLAAALLERKKAGRPVRFFHFEIDPDAGPCAVRRSMGCGAGQEYLAVTPEGDLYPCHQFVGDTAFRMGSLKEGVAAPHIGARFGQNSVHTKPECAACWAKYYCGGGCAANAYNRAGDIARNDEAGCALMRKRVECALWLFSKQMMV